MRNSFMSITHHKIKLWIPYHEAMVQYENLTNIKQSNYVPPFYTGSVGLAIKKYVLHPQLHVYVAE